MKAAASGRPRRRGLQEDVKTRRLNLSAEDIEPAYESKDDIEAQERAGADHLLGQKLLAHLVVLAADEGHGAALGEGAHARGAGAGEEGDGHCHGTDAGGLSQSREHGDEQGEDDSGPGGDEAEKAGQQHYHREYQYLWDAAAKPASDDVSHTHVNGKTDKGGHAADHNDSGPGYLVLHHVRRFCEIQRGADHYAYHGQDLDVELRGKPFGHRIGQEHVAEHGHHDEDHHGKDDAQSYLLVPVEGRGLLDVGRGDLIALEHKVHDEEERRSRKYQRQAVTPYNGGGLLLGESVGRDTAEHYTGAGPRLDSPAQGPQENRQQSQHRVEAHLGRQRKGDGAHKDRRCRRARSKSGYDEGGRVQGYGQQLGPFARGVDEPGGDALDGAVFRGVSVEEGHDHHREEKLIGEVADNIGYGLFHQDSADEECQHKAGDTYVAPGLCAHHHRDYDRGQEYEQTGCSRKFHFYFLSLFFPGLNRFTMRP